MFILGMKLVVNCLLQASKSILDVQNFCHHTESGKEIKHKVSLEIISSYKLL
jgi:hypothetical protein